MDVDCWATIVELLSVVDHNRRPAARSADPFGEMRVVLLGGRIMPALMPVAASVIGCAAVI